MLAETAPFLSKRANTSVARPSFAIQDSFANSAALRAGLAVSSPLTIPRRGLNPSPPLSLERACRPRSFRKPADNRGNKYQGGDLPGCRPGEFPSAAALRVELNCINYRGGGCIFMPPRYASIVSPCPPACSLHGLHTLNLKSATLFSSPSRRAESRAPFRARGATLVHGCFVGDAYARISVPRPLGERPRASLQISVILSLKIRDARVQAI